MSESRRFAGNKHFVDFGSVNTAHINIRVLNTKRITQCLRQVSINDISGPENALPQITVAVRTSCQVSTFASHAIVIDSTYSSAYLTGHLCRPV